MCSNILNMMTRPTFFYLHAQLKLCNIFCANSNATSNDVLNPYDKNIFSSKELVLFSVVWCYHDSAECNVWCNASWIDILRWYHLVREIPDCVCTSWLMLWWFIVNAFSMIVRFLTHGNLNVRVKWGHFLGIGICKLDIFFYGNQQTGRVFLSRVVLPGVFSWCFQSHSYEAIRVVTNAFPPPKKVNWISIVTSHTRLQNSSEVYWTLQICNNWTGS